MSEQVNLNEIQDLERLNQAPVLTRWKGFSKYTGPAFLEAVTTLLDRQAGGPEWLVDVAQIEQKIDDMTDEYRRDQLIRMRDGICSDEACILYSELLTDFERIGDHVLNIAQELTKSRTNL